MALTLIVVASLSSVHAGYPRGPKPQITIFLKELRASLWGLVMPVIIIGSIRYGIATPTEASVIAVAYAVFVGMAIYRTIRLKDLPRIVLDAALTTGIVMLIAGATLLRSDYHAGTDSPACSGDNCASPLSSDTESGD